MNKKITLMILYLVFITSCTAKKSEFLIHNKTKFSLDSVKISCSGSNYLKPISKYSLKQNETSTMVLDMENIEKNDGNYQIEVFSEKFTKKRAFGYYSNGFPSGSIYTLEIKNDSIIISERVR